jgi:PP-loop superfamily ATP-utilizing enzyme
MYIVLEHFDLITVNKLEKLRQKIVERDDIMVSFSGGVDSSLLAKISYDVLCEKALAVTLDSETFPGSELEHATIVAASIGIWHPFVEVGMKKADIREIARYLGLPWWNKSSMPCMASRIEYGERITREKLKMIEDVEEFMKSHGLRFPGSRWVGSLSLKKTLLED